MLLRMPAAYRRVIDTNVMKDTYAEFLRFFCTTRLLHFTNDTTSGIFCRDADTYVRNAFDFNEIDGWTEKLA